MVLLAMSCRAVEAVEITGSGTHRLRYESLHHGPRPTAAASDELLVSRLLARVDAQQGPWVAALELQDSRAWLHSAATPLGTDDVNTLEPLQAWVGYRGGAQLPLDVTVGRMTKEWQTRRLVARNRFRNTLNSFTGVDATWRGDDWRVNAFSLRPLTRLPDSRAALEGNDRALDQPAPGTRFWGVEVQPDLDNGGAIYLLGLSEADDDTISPRRDLLTLGTHWRRPLGSRGYQAGEVALQWGDVTGCSSCAASGPTTHRAWFVHLEAGRRIGDGRHRLRLALDLASGDRDANDDRHQQFDTLFGARRFEYGPSGMFGTQARANLISPELRLSDQPAAAWQWFVAWRGFWLMAPEGVQAGTGFQPPPGNRQRHVGQQLEARLRWDPSPKLRLETGVAVLGKGGLLQGEAFAQGDHPSSYLYWQSTWRW